MRIRAVGIAGAWEVTPAQHRDRRGVFLEWYRHDRLAEVAGRRLELAQANISVSTRGVVRGVHFADVPPGQAKLVTCVRGAVWDVVVDLRRGSPTFGRWEAISLDEVDRKAVFIAEGLGHGFCATTEDATLAYFCSAAYDPDTEHGINPLDGELNIDWPTAHPRLSERDAAAPGLTDAPLPSYQDCLDHYRTLSVPAG